jgi:hypothetical protein
MADQAENVFTAPAAGAPSLPDPVKELVGDGKKYASIEAALASIPHAQNHIKTLETEQAAAKAKLAKFEQEVAELRAEQEKTDKLDTILAKIEASRSTPSDPQAVGVDASEISRLVKTTLSEVQESAVKVANQQAANDKMLELFGEKAAEVVANKAKDLGIGIDFLQSTAQRSPKAFFELMGVTKDTTPRTGAMGSINAAALQQPAAPMSTIVKAGASTKDMRNAWKAAGEAIRKN